MQIYIYMYSYTHIYRLLLIARLILPIACCLLPRPLTWGPGPSAGPAERGGGMEWDWGGLSCQDTYRIVSLGFT